MHIPQVVTLQGTRIVCLHLSLQSQLPVIVLSAHSLGLANCVFSEDGFPMALGNEIHSHVVGGPMCLYVHMCVCP